MQDSITQNSRRLILRIGFKYDVVKSASPCPTAFTKSGRQLACEVLLSIEQSGAAGEDIVAPT